MSGPSYKDKNPHLSWKVLVTLTWVYVGRGMANWGIKVQTLLRGRRPSRYSAAGWKGTYFLGLNPSEKKGQMLESHPGQPQMQHAWSLLTMPTQSRGSHGTLGQSFNTPDVYCGCPTGS